MCPQDDDQAGKWRKQIADAEAPQKRLCDELRNAIDDSELHDRVRERKERVEAGDPDLYFACTRDILEAVGESPVWRIAWNDATRALEGRDYAAALDALAKAAKADPERKGELAVPTLDAEPALVTVTAGQARERVAGMKQLLRRAWAELEQHLTKDDKEAAKSTALGIMRLDPANWAEHTAQAAEAYTRLQLADDFVLIAGGSLHMGVTPALMSKALQDGALKGIREIEDATKLEVTVPRFFMSIRLVSVSEYCAFLNAAQPAQVGKLLQVGPGSDVLMQDGAYTCAEDKAGLPITRVTWLGAKAYWDRLQGELRKRLGPAAQHVELCCRLPTEAEWEFAASWKPDARGPGDKRLYAGFERAAEAPRDTGPRSVRERTDVAPCGCLDLSSNVRQWVADWYGPYPAERQDSYHGPPSGQKRVVRGGSFEKGVGLSFRRWKALPGAKLADVGFRVVVVVLVR